ncbi:LAMI_0F11386g1_1 [Lachancea mirantina]|uniref:LAMI_0F11386g1_1 n=1 Tax=Lachancea mirantina TaxID=1230905 RepID=A0A1G4K2F1_9SACH|nr:LAMI_0F11386g1_1 [Lachancea mirantina]
MITDSFALAAIAHIDRDLELGLQKVSLLPATRGPGPSNYETLQAIQDCLLDVKQEVDKLKSGLRQKRPSTTVNVRALLAAVQRLERATSANGASSPSVASQQDLVPLVHDAITRYVTICLYYSVVSTCIRQLPQLRDTQQYYSQVTSSVRWSLLYGVQVLPAKTLRFAQAVIEDSRDGVARPLANASQWALKTVHQWDKWAKIHTYQLVGLSKSPNTLNGSVWELPFAAIRKESSSKSQTAREEFEICTARLGRLVSAFPHATSADDAKNLIAEFLDVPEGEYHSLSSLVRAALAFCPASAVETPSLLTRYWPTLLSSLVFGPTLIITAWQSRYKLATLLKENLFDFGVGLVKNWIWVPLQQVWSTVRHDESESTIAVMSKGSLDTELSSLTRMVVQAVVDNSHSSVDVDLLTRNVEQGDLTEFMQIYETQLHHPIKNIATGGLVRSLLIQLQKTKVDGSLALNGIDKLLQSQQLVFGVVALSPALLIVYCVWTCTYRLAKLGRIWSNVATFKLKLSASLNNIERLLNCGDSVRDDHDSDLNAGLLALEISSAHTYGEKLVPRSRQTEWYRDVDDLVSAELSNTAKLNVVNRLYHVYAPYF